MAKDKLTDYSATNASNTDVGGINIDEGMLPSDVNNAIREVMTHLKDFAEGTQAVNSISVTGNVSMGSASTTGNITFGDGGKAIFGTGSDLEIRHTGAASDIKEQGTGNLRIWGDDIQFFNTAGTKYHAQMVSSGAVTLYNNGQAKLATTSSGIDVQGSVTADGLTVEAGSQANIQIGNIGPSSNAAINIGRNDTTIFNGNPLGYVQFLGSDNTAGSLTAHAYIGAVATSSHAAGSNPTEIVIGTTDSGSETIIDRVTVGHNGDISFYDNTGVTQGFFWDASTQRLGLGTTAPDAPINIEFNNAGNSSITTSTIGTSSIILNDTDTGGGYRNLGLVLKTGAGEGVFYAAHRTSSSNINAVIGTNDTARMTITSGGNVGIGTSSPDSLIEVSGASAPQIKVTDTRTPTEIVLKAENGIGVLGTTTNHGFRFLRNAVTEVGRFDASGNLLVGKTTADGAATAGSELRPDGTIRCARANTIGVFNRLTTDGNIIEFEKSGTQVGVIGTPVGTDIMIGTGDTGLRFVDVVDAISPCSTNGIQQDNLTDLGRSAFRFDDIYATNGTIQTSDENEKQDIEALSDAEQRVAVAAKGLLRKYRWKSSVEEKGDDARIHFGIIAQDLKAAFEAEGLDAGRYAMFINSEWTDEETGEQKSRMGIRYNQLLAFIIAAI